MNKVNRVNIFENGNVSREFYAIMMKMKSPKKEAFIKGVHELFDKKAVSEEGQYNLFKITKDDLKNILLDIEDDFSGATEGDR